MRRCLRKQKAGPVEQGWTLTKGGGREGFTSGYTIEGAEKMPRVTATDEQGWPGRNEGLPADNVCHYRKPTGRWQLPGLLGDTG